MSTLERAFIATSDKTYKKVEAKDGRIMHFMDGKPIKEGTFNMVDSKYHKLEGEMAKIAVPSDKGPGYERKEISPIEASSIGQEVAYLQGASKVQARETVIIDGVEYSTQKIGELNERIIGRHKNIDAIYTYAA